MVVSCNGSSIDPLYSAYLTAMKLPAGKHQHADFNKAPPGGASLSRLSAVFQKTKEEALNFLYLF